MPPRPAPAVLALCASDGELLETTLRALQAVAALARGLLATQPRPKPRGEWGRPDALQTARPRSVTIEAPQASPAAPAPLREPPKRPPKATRPYRSATRRHHTPESIAADIAKVNAWAKQVGMSPNALSREAGLNSGIPSLILHGRMGLSVRVEAALLAAMERLRKRQAARS